MPVQMRGSPGLGDQLAENGEEQQEREKLMGQSMSAETVERFFGFSEEVSAARQNQVS